MGFRMTKTETQCIEDLSINEVFIEREDNVLRFDVWNSYYEPHFTVDFIYLFSVADLISFLLVVAFCLSWGETHKRKVTQGHKTPPSQPPRTGQLLTDGGFALPTPSSCLCFGWASPCRTFCAAQMMRFGGPASSSIQQSHSDRLFPCPAACPETPSSIFRPLPCGDFPAETSVSFAAPHLDWFRAPAQSAIAAAPTRLLGLFLFHTGFSRNLDEDLMQYHSESYFLFTTPGNVI